MHNIFKTYLLLTALGLSHATPAEVVLDGTLGPSGPLPGDDFAIGADLGQKMGNNLFHSFERFNLNQNESATFSGPNHIQNIISRVTGGNLSTIDGTIISEIPNADMYFLNPAGIFFGPNAKLNVQGSFYTSTADYLRLGDNGRFDIRQPQNSLLTVAPPSAFGFLDEPPASIEKQGYLAVPDGKTLALIGGNLTLQDDALTEREQPVIRAFGGQVHLVSVASSGEIPVDPKNLSEKDFEQFGTIKLTDTPINAYNFDNRFYNANIDVSGNGGGKLYIQGGKIIIENALLYADNMEGTGNGQGITVKATDKFSMKGLSNLSSTVLEKSAGNGGNIDIVAREIQFTDGVQITTGSESSGMAGHITLKATEKITISGFSQIDDGEPFESKLSAQTRGTGDGGKITVIAPAVILENGSVIFAQTTGQGNAGDISLQVDTFTLKKGAQVSVNSGTREISTGEDGGTLTIIAKESVLITGQLDKEKSGFSDTKESALTSNTFTTNKGGSIIVSAPLLEVQDNGTIQAATQFFDGKGGQILLDVDTLSISKNGSITTQTLDKGLGGTMDIRAHEINLTGNGFITADTSGQGNAGNIEITADHINVTDQGRIFAISQYAKGDKGNENKGNAGEIVLQVGELNLSGIDSSIDSSTETNGQGGDIRIEGTRLFLSDGAKINAGSKGQGDGGNLVLTLTEPLRINNASITTDTKGADGGNITISSPSYLYLKNSKITASAKDETQKGGSGGTIILKPEFIVLDGGEIRADAGEGQGGYIQIMATSIYNTHQGVVKPYQSEEKLITATSESKLEGMDGVVEIDVSDVNVIESMMALPANFINVARLLPTPCDTKHAENQSTFMMVPSKGFVNALDDLLPSGLMLKPLSLEQKPPIKNKNITKKHSLSTVAQMMDYCNSSSLKQTRTVKKSVNRYHMETSRLIHEAQLF